MSSYFTLSGADANTAGLQEAMLGSLAQLLGVAQNMITLELVGSDAGDTLPMPNYTRNHFLTNAIQPYRHFQCPITPETHVDTPIMLIMR